MTDRREFIVIGAGLLGLAAARALASRGREVMVLEQARIGHPAGGSHGSCRIFRLGYGDPGYVAMASRARDLWRALETERGLRLLHPTPQLTFGAGLDAVHAAMSAAGAPCELLSAATAASRFPALATAGPALLEPDSCVIEADNALRALAATVPVISTGVRVAALADDGRQVTISTDAGPFTARVVIVCAGPWTSGLLRRAGRAVPASATRELVAYLERGADGPDVPIFICHGARSPYGLPVPRSSLYKIGIHPSGPPVDPDRQDQGADGPQAGQLDRIARRYLPGLDPRQAGTEHCIYDNTPDEDFVLDRAGQIVVGSGTSGHGFKFGPLLGEWLADLAAGTPPAAPWPRMARRFAVRRFGIRGSGPGDSVA